MRFEVVLTEDAERDLEDIFNYVAMFLGDQEYRQAFFKPHRHIYRLVGQQVVIYLVADGRRDMQSLLARRLLGG